MTEPGTPLPPRHHWLPSIPATVFIGVLSFVAFGFQEPLLNSDGDLARHIRHGRWMLEHHALISADPFSYTKFGQPFVGFEYGSQLVYALADRVGGLAAVTILAALLIATAYALLARFLLRRRVEPLLAGITVAAAIVCGMGHWLARPHLFTLLLLPVLLELLLPISRWRLWPIPPLFAIWANLHGGFVYGLVVVGIFLVASLWDLLHHRGGSGHRARFYGAALPLSIAATLATPHGIRLYQHIFAILHETYVLNHTGEFASPNFHDPATKLFLAILLGVIWAGFASSRRASAVTILVILGWTYFSLVHQRDITLFGFTALPILALHIDPAWRSASSLRRLRRFESTAAAASTAPWVLTAALAASLLGTTHGRAVGVQLIGDQFDRKHMPIGAVDAARRAHLDGRLFADFGWGGYILYAWPEQRVFIDGGADFYGSALMRDYGIIRSVRPGWSDLMRRWDISILLVRRNAPIATELVSDHDWRYWYCDSVSVLLIRPDRIADRLQAPLGDARKCKPDQAADETAS